MVNILSFIENNSVGNNEIVAEDVFEQGEIAASIETNKKHVFQESKARELLHSCLKNNKSAEFDEQEFIEKLYSAEWAEASDLLEGYMAYDKNSFEFMVRKLFVFNLITEDQYDKIINTYVGIGDI